jgi:MarR family transcriptional regulator, organic hydroperoxide resistance regulator
MVLFVIVITEIEVHGVLAELQRATHATLNALAASLAELSLTGSEQNVLAALADGQTRSVGELANATGTKPSTLTSVLDRLERRGQLERDVDYTDRRSVLIRLTPAGRWTAAKVREAIKDLEKNALKGISKQQLAGFFTVTLALAEVAR